MTMGLVGRKRGMTRVFTEDGNSIPVTVIEAQPNRITQVKSVENDGYRALQVSAGFRKASRVSKPAAGHFAMAKVEAGDLMTEFRLGADEQPEARDFRAKPPEGVPKTSTGNVSDVFKRRQPPGSTTSGRGSVY